MQLLGEHHCITFQLGMQRKDESFNACHFSPPAKCTPTVSQNFHSGGGVLWRCRSTSLSILRVPLALRARSDHVFTLLIKKHSTLHVLPILSARRGCPHSQPKNSQWGGGGGALEVALVEFVYSACSRRLVQEPLPSAMWLQ